jgi:hypothetical protein
MPKSMVCGFPGGGREEKTSGARKARKLREGRERRQNKIQSE